MADTTPHWGKDFVARLRPALGTAAAVGVAPTGIVAVDRQWDRFIASVPETDTIRTVTCSSTPVLRFVHWIDQIDPDGRMAVQSTAEAVCRTAIGRGVAPADLAALARARTATEGGPDHAGLLFERGVVTIARSRPEMAVRDAMGWMLVTAHGTALERLPLFRVRVRRWVEDAGFGEDAWRFAAAGLTPHEVAAAPGGAVSEDQWRTLAALRGCPLPAGT